MGEREFCRKCYEWVEVAHVCTPKTPRPKRTMGLEAGAHPLTDAEVEARLNCYGPACTGRLLATIETRDARIEELETLLEEDRQSRK